MLLLSLSVGLCNNKNNKQTTHVEPIVKRFRTGVQLPPLPQQTKIKPFFTVFYCLKIIKFNNLQFYSVFCGIIKNLYSLNFWGYIWGYIERIPYYLHLKIQLYPQNTKRYTPRHLILEFKKNIRLEFSMPALLLTQSFQPTPPNKPPALLVDTHNPIALSPTNDHRHLPYNRNPPA